AASTGSELAPGDWLLLFSYRSGCSGALAGLFASQEVTAVYPSGRAPPGARLSPGPPRAHRDRRRAALRAARSAVHGVRAPRARDRVKLATTSKTAGWAQGDGFCSGVFGTGWRRISWVSSPDLFR